ncbi:MAG: 2-oxoacid:acceptor oxidoreductase family protein [Thermodesulfobacteriota bacterium]
MIEARLHGRGGQGAVTAAELVAQAAIAEGKYAQGFPSFGPERRGAPVTAYLRVSPSPISLREPVNSPDVVVVLDNSLIGLVDVAEGLVAGGALLVNLPPDQEDKLSEYKGKFRLALVDASAIAMDELGVAITNTAIIGALVKAMGLCALDSLDEPLARRFGRLAPKNRAALRRAYDECRIITADAEPAAKVQPGFRIEAQQPWAALALGGDITAAGSSRNFETGNWRTAGYPVTNTEECIKCGLCWALCPDMAYSQNQAGYYDWSGRYCKGCGVCAEECPKGAIAMKVG